MEPRTTGTIADHTENAPAQACELDWWSAEPVGEDDVWQPPVGFVVSGWGAPTPAGLGEADDEADIKLIESRREEPALSHDEVKARLRADGLLPD